MPDWKDSNGTLIDPDDLLEITEGQHAGERGKAVGWMNDCTLLKIPSGELVSVPRSDIRLVERAPKMQILTQDAI